MVASERGLPVGDKNSVLAYLIFCEFGNANRFVDERDAVFRVAFRPCSWNSPHVAMNLVIPGKPHFARPGHGEHQEAQRQARCKVV